VHVLCRPHTLHGGGNSRSLPSTVTVMPGDVNSPYHKQFVHSKSQQYRRLKTEWRNNVYLRRSNVQVCLLFYQPSLYMSTDFGRCSFSYSSAATWNSIPTCIENCSSLYSFKRLLKSHLMAQLINN